MFGEECVEMDIVWGKDGDEARGGGGLGFMLGARVQARARAWARTLVGTRARVKARAKAGYVVGPEVMGDFI